MGNAQARRPVDERAWDEDYQGEDVEIVVPAVEFRFSDLAAVTDNFHETYMLRKGFFGHIYRAPLQNVEVTVRMLRQDGVMQDGDFIATVNRLRNLNHANLMQLQGYSVDGPNRLLVYEYRPWRSLEYYLKDDRIRALDRMRRIKIAAGVAYGLDYLHRHFVMYGEFKPASILLDEEFNPRLTDFGVVTGLNKDAKSNYSPPDRLLTRRSDSYGFGLIVLQLLTGRELDTNLREWAKKMRNISTGSPYPLLKNSDLLDSFNDTAYHSSLCTKRKVQRRSPIPTVAVKLGYLQSQNDQSQS